MPTNTQHHAPDSTQSAILHHTLPDGTAHYDWLIEIPARQDEHRLLTFVAQSRPDLWQPGELFHVEQSPNHRAHYLQFQGNIDKKRGHVTRTAAGHCVGFRGDPEGDELVIQIQWEEIEEEPWVVRYFGQKSAQKRWSFRCEQIGLA